MRCDACIPRRPGVSQVSSAWTPCSSTQDPHQFRARPGRLGVVQLNRDLRGQRSDSIMGGAILLDHVTQGAGEETGAAPPGSELSPDNGRVLYKIGETRLELSRPNVVSRRDSSYVPGTGERSTRSNI
jgi:hypothetical protein